MNMAGAHTEAVLNKLSKLLLDHSKKLEVDVAIVRNVNNELVERVVATERQCWKNAQYIGTLKYQCLLEIMFLSRKFET